jgi:rod shape-determining protein MreB
MFLDKRIRLFGSYSGTFHIQLWKNKFRITDTVSHEVFEFVPSIAYKIDNKGNGKILAIGHKTQFYQKEATKIVNPMLHPRVIIDDFMAMELMFEYAFKAIRKSIRLIAPKVTVEGGLTIVEYKILRDIAMNAGAREVTVKDGEKIIDENSFHL